MKTCNFSENQNLKSFKENEVGRFVGRFVGEVSREFGGDKSAIYYWCKKYGEITKEGLQEIINDITSLAKKYLSFY